MRYILFLLLTAAIISCQSKKAGEAAKSAFSIDSAMAHILKMNESYSQRFTTNDSAFYVERYCHDAEVYAPNMPSVKGREAIRKFFYNDGNNKEATIELPPGNFYGGPDYVVEDGTYNFPDGKGGSADKGKFIALWKQEDGKWKLYREIWNTDMMPPPPPPSK
jgi:ketosteroid isomerase-like protein